jgi:hypothetical protein
MLTFHSLLDEVEWFFLNDVQPVKSGLVLQPNSGIDFRLFTFPLPSLMTV